MPSNCNGGSCFVLTNFWKKKKKKKNLPLNFGYFNVSVNSSTFLTVPWLSIFVLAEHSRTILLIDRSEPRFESRTEGKIKKTLKINGNFDIFLLVFG